MLSPTAPVQTVTVINFMRGTNCSQISALILSHLKEIFLMVCFRIKAYFKTRHETLQGKSFERAMSFLAHCALCKLQRNKGCIQVV